MFCDKCGIELPDDSIFCNKCGNQILKNQNTTNNVQINENSSKSGIATASMVLGIIAIIFCCVPYFNIISIILGILSIIFAIITFSKKIKSGQAIAGLVLSIIALVFALLIIISLNAANDLIKSAQQELLGNYSYYTNK